MTKTCFNDLFISLLKKVYERGAFFQSEKVYERGTFSEKNGIENGKGLDLGAEPPRIKLFCVPPLPGVGTVSFEPSVLLKPVCNLSR